jgi:TPR repeat protein
MVSILRRLAEEGCAQAQLEYSRALPMGPFGTRHPAHGWTWRARAARTLPEAQHSAAFELRLTPHPLPRDVERQARAWELAAARAGHTGAMRDVAWWSMRLPRTPAMLRRASRWLRRAVAAGDGRAAHALALDVETFAGDLDKVERLLERAVLLDEDDADCLWPLLFLRWARPWLRGLPAHPTEEWRRRAEAGDFVAQTYLACAYRFGRGLPYEPDTAQAWFERAARAGYAEAAVALGLQAWDYEVDVALEDAAAWFAKAARTGDPLALYGAAFFDGFAERPNHRRGFRWCLAAANQGHVRAAFGVAKDYSRGTGVGANARAAARWMRVAADGGLPEAQIWYAEMLSDGDGVRRDPRAAVTWLRRAAEQGNSDAQQKLGYRLHEGLGCRRNDREAVLWYRRAARHGNAAAMNNLGLCFKDGHGVPKSVPNALRWFRRAVFVGEHPVSASKLAWGFEDGWAGRKDLVEAARWLQHAAALAGPQGDGEELGELGVAYHGGHGVPKDHDFAALLYRAAADRGDPWGTHCLGLCYRDGEGVPKSLARARLWWRKAARLGVEPARARLRNPHPPVKAKAKRRARRRPR